MLALCLAACRDTDRDKAGGNEPAEATVLTFASNNGGLDPQIQAFAQEVERLSNGALRIEFTDNWREGEPDQEKGMIEDVQNGRIDIAWVGARAFESVGVTSFPGPCRPVPHR